MGGLLGRLYIVAAIVLAPRLGAATLVAALVAGQIVASCSSSAGSCWFSAEERTAHSGGDRCARSPTISPPYRPPTRRRAPPTHPRCSPTSPSWHPRGEWRGIAPPGTGRQRSRWR